MLFLPYTVMINVALDGPAGAGKSTIAKAAAERLGFLYVDTGALYRTIGVNALRKGVDLLDAQAVASTLDDSLHIEMKYENAQQRMYLNGEDVSQPIRTPEASAAASKVSAVPQVRTYLLDLQRDIAAHNNCLMDGRDIGTVVLPDAQVKIFLTADVQVRAGRRYRELCEKGIECSFDEVLSDMQKRDYDDSHRAIAPLKPAEGCIMIDTSTFTLEQSVEAVVSAVTEKTDTAS